MNTEFVQLVILQSLKKKLIGKNVKKNLKNFVIDTENLMVIMISLYLAAAVKMEV